MDDTKPVGDTVETGTQKELTTEYANNTYIEPSIWDIKVLFGEWSGRSNSVDWHTSITMPWAQAKLLVYYLQINIALREMREGKILISPSVIPKEPAPVPSESDNPESRRFFEWFQEHHKMFIENLAEPKGE